LWEEDDGAGEDGDDEEEDNVDGISDADNGNVDVSGSGDGPGADGTTALSAARLLPEARFSRYNLSHLGCPSAVSPMILIGRLKWCMTLFSSVPWTLLASAGVRVAGSLAGC